MEGERGREVGPRTARGLVVAVAAALASVHLLKGLARVPAHPGAGISVVAACLALVALQLRHTRPARTVAEPHPGPEAEAGGAGANANADAGAAAEANGNGPEARPSIGAKVDAIAEADADAGGVAMGRAGPAALAWTTTAELAIGFLAVGPLGVSAGLLGLPAASLLLERRHRLLPLFALGAVVVEAVRATDFRNAVDLLLTVALGGVMLYAVTTLCLLANRVHAARLTLAAAAVTDERLRIAGGLAGGLAEGLTEIRELASRDDPAALGPLIAVARRTLGTARATAAELRSLSLAPEAASARALLSSAGIAAEIRVGHREPLGPAGTVLATVLREAVTAVVRVGDARRCEIRTEERAGRVVLRVVSDGLATAAPGAEVLDELADRVHDAGGRIGTGLEPDGRFAVEASVAATPVTAAADPPELRTPLGLYLFLLAAFCVKALMFVPASRFPLGLLCALGFCALQFRFSVQDASRFARAALLVSAGLALLPLPWLGLNWIGAAGILAGSLLIALPTRAGVMLAGALSLSAALIEGGSPGTVLLTLVNVLITCVVVYGMLRLIRLVRELQQAGAGLARAAVVGERLRAARDLHDLLGHGLAAILLKAELARRLAESDEGRARTELKDIVRLAERGQSELDAVAATDGPLLSFAAELASAAAVLEAAAISVELEDDEAAAVPAEAGAVLGVVLREAVTNVLRHSSARHARIAVALRDGAARLDVENDGAPEAVTPPGSGIGGLTLRLGEAGGTLSAGPDDGWYLLHAELPLR